MFIIELKRKRILKQALSNDLWLTLIQADPSELAHVPQQTLEMCFAAVSKDATALKYVDPVFSDQASAMIAVLEKPSSFFDIDHQFGSSLPIEIAIAAVRKDPHKLLIDAWDMCFIFDRTVYAAALKLDGTLIDYIDPPDRNQLIDLALRTTPSAIVNLSGPEKTHQRCLDVVLRDGMLLEHTVQGSADICTNAILQNPMAIEFVQQLWQTPELFLTAMQTASDQGQLQPFINCFFVKSNWSLPLKAQLLGLVNTVLALDPVAYPDHLVQKLVLNSLKLR